MKSLLRSAAAVDAKASNASNIIEFQSPSALAGPEGIYTPDDIRLTSFYL